MKTKRLSVVPSLERRLNSIERAVKDLTVKKTKRKDIWDKVSSTSALTSGIIVALIGGTFTYFYNSRTAERDAQSKIAQERLQELQTIVQFMPYLTGKDETSKRYAITAINTLANTTIATELAKLNPSTGVEEGLVAIVRQAGNTRDRQLAETALAQVRCGLADWALKTLTDPESSQIDTHQPVHATIEELRQLKRPLEAGEGGILRKQNIRSDQEKKTFVVRGRLTAVKLEASSDYALVLADPNNPNNTLTARIPDPECAYGSPFRTQFLGARKAVSGFLGVNPSDKFTKTNTDVEVEGVGYFVLVHGQRGVAPNGFELHPVLSIQYLTPTKTR